MATYPQSSFTSGELAPALHRRPDLARYITGLKTCRNYFVHPEGGASNRAGFEFVVEVKDSTKKTRVIDFAFNTLQAYALEVGDQYLRVVKDGGQMLLPSAPAAWADTTVYSKTDHVSQSGTNYYCLQDHTSVAANDQPGTGTNWTDFWYALTTDIVEIPTPYLEAELFDLQYVQSADVITITHPNHPPAELSRFDHHLWSLDVISFAPTISAPTGLAGTGGTAPSYNYVVTAISEETGEESVASASAANNEDLGVLSWNAVTGAEFYAIYKEKNGVYGFIGTAEGLSFTDEKIIPELDDTPPRERDLFTGAGNYPSTAMYHEQRLGFANTTTKPQTIWLSQTANFHNFNVSSPLKADDAITLRIDAAQVNSIQHLVSLTDLLVMTAGAEHKITSGDNAFAFENLRRLPQSYRGSSYLRPVVIGSTVIFVQARGSHVRDLEYQLENDGYRGNSISILSNHLFRKHTLVDWAYAQEVDSIIWAVRDDGVLLGLTYMKEHEVQAWHRHDTAGLFESVCSIPEGQEDAVYVVVQRTINSVTKRYIERQHTRQFSDVTECFFVDSGLTYSGVPNDTISGLGHLEGETVSILADGNVHPPLTVASGAITLDYEASVIHIGLPYQADLHTLEPPIEGTASKPKTANKLTVGVLESRGMWAGPNEDYLEEIAQRQDELWGDPIALKTGYFELSIQSDFDNYGQVLIRQIDPLPITVLSIIPDYDVGD